MIKQFETGHSSGMCKIEKIDVESPDMDDVVSFYNESFKKSQHTKNGKKKKYKDASRQAVALQVKIDGKIAGLLEAYNDQNDQTQKVLETFVIDSKYRKKGYGRKLFEKAREIVTKDKNINKWIVHFRDNNKEDLFCVYSNLGFSDLKQASDNYKDREKKWEMTMDA